MKSAANDFKEKSERERGMGIGKSNTILIDDDFNNIKIALLEGVKAVLLKPSDADNFPFYFEAATSDYEITEMSNEDMNFMLTVEA